MDPKKSNQKQEKPDNIVFDTASEKYDAALKPYATNLGAPVIAPDNLVPWKNKGIRSVNAVMEAEFEEIQQQYRNLQRRFEYNTLVYSAKFSFQPIVGNVYHLYRKANGETFLSILAPDECTFDHVGSFRLGSDHVWERQETL